MGNQPVFSSAIKDRIFDAKKRFEAEKRVEWSWAKIGRETWRLLGRTEGDSGNWIDRIKNGVQPPSVLEAGALSYLFDVSPMWLCWDIGEMSRFPAAQMRVPAAESITPSLPTVATHPVEVGKPKTKSAGPSAKKSGGRGR